MRAFVLIVIVASLAISTTAIPSEEELEESQTQTRPKRQFISTTSVLHAPVAASTTYHHAPGAVAIPQTESYVWQRSPDVTYYLHQRHSPSYSSYYYPNYYPNYYNNYQYYPTTTLLGSQYPQYLNSPYYYYGGWKK